MRSNERCALMSERRWVHWCSRRALFCLLPDSGCYASNHCCLHCYHCLRHPLWKKKAKKKRSLTVWPGCKRPCCWCGTVSVSFCKRQQTPNPGLSHDFNQILPLQITDLCSLRLSLSLCCQGLKTWTGRSKKLHSVKKFVLFVPNIP